MIAVSYAAAVV